MVVKRGETGTYVKWLQQGLHIMCCYDGTIDSTFGAGTESGVKKYQGKNGLDQDGMAGPATWNCLMSDIQAIQTALKSKGYYRYGSVSGYANDETYNSVLEFQGNNHLDKDGRVGPLTRELLFDTLTNDYAVLPMSRGSKGTYVNYLQRALRMLCCSPGAIDGTFGAGTETAVSKFQAKYNLSQTGTVDTTTWDTLKSKILEVEQKLSSLNYSLGKVDGIATAATGEALVKFQADNSLAQDGQIGPATRKALFGTTVEGGNDDLPLKRGSRGPNVLYLQQALRIMVINPKGTDGVFGPGCESAVSRYQSKKGLSSTGIVDIDTWEKLRADITPIQIALKNKGYDIPACDGIATEDTYNAVLKYQTDNGMTADGMVGPTTRAALLGGTDGSGTVSYVQKLGSNGALARYLQHMLNVLGYQITINGIFSEETKNAVLSFQTAHGLDPDGQVGPATWTKLFEVYSVPVSGTGLQRFLNIAKYEADWGYHEDNENNITPYGQWYGLNGNAWCAMFVSWCAHYAGITNTLVPKYSWCPSGVSWYKSRGRYHISGNGYVPKIGDIIFFYNAQAGRVSHTGIVIEGTTTHVSTIEGNSSDGVRRKTYNLYDPSIDGYGDNGGTPIHSNKPHATEEEIKVKMTEYFHDLLLPLGVDEEITDGILKNGCTVPTGIPGLTLSVRMVRDMAINTDGVSINLENGELTPSLDVADDLSIAFSSVDMGVLSDIRSLFKSIALSINTGTGNVSFELTAKSFSMSIQFSKDLEIKDGVSIEAGVEYKLTYEMPDIKDEITQALSEITETILTFYEEHKTVARVIMVVSILFLAGLATYSFLSTSAGIALLTAIKAGLLQLLPIWISQF